MVCLQPQSLVRRGELIIAFDVIDNWDTELKQMNKDKIGEPFHYPNTFLLSYLTMPKYISTCLTDKPRVLYRAMLKEKFLHLSHIILHNKQKNKPIEHQC